MKREKGRKYNGASELDRIQSPKQSPSFCSESQFWSKEMNAARTDGFGGNG